MDAAPARSPHTPLFEGILATITYAALTIVLTWPLVRGLARDVAGDFGDPLFESWVMAWDATHLGPGFWNANIFFPHPLTLAYSEHLLPQALVALPVYQLTHNPLLGYNLVFLSTFVLSGTAMFVLARDLTSNVPAAFVAGIAYAFAPYRFANLPHMQVLSSQWLPLVLLGFRRYFAERRPAALAGAAAAWFVQNLSCLYYVVFFAPIVALYLAWEIIVRKLWRSGRMLLAVGATCAAVAAATGAFMRPYFELRQMGVSPRSLAETDRFSADTYAYLTASPNLRLLGPVMQAWPRNEGLLFPGFTITLLALAGISTLGRSRSADSLTGVRLKSIDSQTANRERGARAAVRLAGLLLGADLVMLVALLFGFGLRLPLLRVTSIGRAATAGVFLALVILAVSSEARQTLRRWLTSPVSILALMTIFAVAMSWGPHIHAKGRVVADPSIYALFYDVVPGFDGVRVPARFAMAVAFGLAALAAFGIRALNASNGRTVPALASALIVAESFAVPLTINDNSAGYKQQGLTPPPSTLALNTDDAAAYQFVAALPPSAAIVELPLGEPTLDVRYMLYSTRHWKPLVNGYSGVEPEDYAALGQRLQDIESRPAPAWEAVRSSGATHAVVHEALYQDGRGRQVSEWLRVNGAREAAAFGRTRVFRLR